MVQWSLALLLFCNYHHFVVGTCIMSASTQQSSYDRLTGDYAFRSISSFIHVIKAKSALQTASEPQFFFSNKKNNLTPMEQHQFRINTTLLVCAVCKDKVITVLSSTKKIAGISSSYIVIVNPRYPLDRKNLHLQQHDALVYRTMDSNNTTPHLVSGKVDKLFLSNPIKTYLWV